MAENAEAQEAEKPKGKLKLILIILVAVLLASGIAVAATLFLAGGNGGDTEEAAEAAAPEFVPSQYFVIDDPLVTSVDAGGKQRYVQLYVAFEAKGPEPLEAARLHLPLIRSRFISELSNSDFEALRTPEGRQALADLLLTDVNEILQEEGEPPVERVLFRNFVVQ
mgnify:FL=1